MSQDVAPKETIRQFARGALSAAGVGDVSRVPVDQVAAAARLHRRELFELGSETPHRFRDIIQKLSGTVLGLLSIEKREYFVDRSMPLPRQRFTEAHEIGHDALPWHEAAFWGDDHTTLHPATKDVLEREANQFAAELLFGAGRFSNQADQYAPGLEVALFLAPQYGASVHAALRQYVEDSGHELAVLATGRFRSTGGTVQVFEAQTCESQRFRKRYGALNSIVRTRVGTAIYPELSTLLSLPTGNAPVCEVTLDTRRGPTKFVAEGFTNGRTNFVVLHKKSKLNGQKLKLVSTDGLELLPA